MLSKEDSHRTLEQQQVGRRTRWGETECFLRCHRLGSLEAKLRWSLKYWIFIRDWYLWEREGRNRIQKKKNSNWDECMTKPNPTPKRAPVPYANSTQVPPKQTLDLGFLWKGGLLGSCSGGGLWRSRSQEDTSGQLALPAAGVAALSLKAGVCPPNKIVSTFSVQRGKHSQYLGVRKDRGIGGGDAEGLKIEERYGMAT